MSNKIEIEYAGTKRPETVRIADLEPGDTFIFQSSFNILEHKQIHPAIFCGLEGSSEGMSAIYIHIGETDSSWVSPNTPVIPIKAKLTWSF